MIVAFFIFLYFLRYNHFLAVVCIITTILNLKRLFLCNKLLYISFFKNNFDLPIANFLSGGLDSTSIVKNMYEQNKSINSFTVGTDSEKYDESKWANIVSEKY